MPLFNILLLCFTTLNVITFFTYGWDKWSAKKHRSRIRESTLHWLSLFGGWPGAWFGQIIFHHKTQKKIFRRIYWLTVIINIGTVIGLFIIQKEGSFIWVRETLYSAFH